MIEEDRSIYRVILFPFWYRKMLGAMFIDVCRGYDAVMQLPVLPPSTDKPKKDPWYADGLQFTCTQCGNCCTGGPGFVWLTTDEIVKLAAYLKMTPEETVEQYCRKIDGKFSLTEVRNAAGNYDCVFLKDVPAARSGKGGDNAEGVQLTKRGCSVYPVRPLQCRTWPFWPENLSNKRTWTAASRKCHGMNVGRSFSINEIHAVRDANDWPKNPPTSAKR